MLTFLPGSHWYHGNHCYASNLLPWKECRWQYPLFHQALIIVDWDSMESDALWYQRPVTLDKKRSVKAVLMWTFLTIITIHAIEFVAYLCKIILSRYPYKFMSLLHLYDKLVDKFIINYNASCGSAFRYWICLPHILTPWIAAVKIVAVRISLIHFFHCGLTWFWDSCQFLFML